jgi:hypothetical protein
MTVLTWPDLEILEQKHEHSRQSDTSHQIFRTDRNFKNIFLRDEEHSEAKPWGNGNKNYLGCGDRTELFKGKGDG